MKSERCSEILCHQLRFPRIDNGYIKSFQPFGCFLAFNSLKSIMRLGYVYSQLRY